MNRRELLKAGGVLSAWRLASAATTKLTHNLGGAPAGFPIRTQQARAAGKTFDFVDYCHSLALGVVETRIDPADPAAAAALRKKVDAYGMRVILDYRLPRQESEVAAFGTAIKSAHEAGAFGLHAAMTQRRYEQFHDLASFRKDFERCQAMVSLAEPVLRKYKVKLAIENHKGWRAAEQAAWLQRISSEWVGVHFDFGNNLSLCEPPEVTLKILQPYAFSCHIKDMGVEPYEDGFLLSEVPLGEGVLDLKGMVRSLQTKDANMPFDLEMITRDPLKIPIFTTQYWATFDDSYSSVPGRDVAALWKLVEKNKPKSPLPQTSGLSGEQRLALEDKLISRSIDYARKTLQIT